MIIFFYYILYHNILKHFPNIFKFFEQKIDKYNNLNYIY